MKQFFEVFKFELLSYFKNKIFVGVTLLLMLVTAVTMFFPRINITSNNDSDNELPIILLSKVSDINLDYVKTTFDSIFSDYKVMVVENDEELIKSKIKNNEAEFGLLLTSNTSYKYYVKNITMLDYNTEIVDTALKKIYELEMMEKNGMDQNEAIRIIETQITHETNNLGNDQQSNFFYTYIMIFALYTVILLYGQMVASNVASEKSSRAMELLITSVKPTKMMFGKVLASCLAGFIQLTCIFGSAILFYKINKEYWIDNSIINSIFNMPTNLLIYLLLFFVLGFLIYAFLYGAVGSTVSKLEDINTSIMPITMIFIIAFMIVVFSMETGEVDNLTMQVASLFPLTSPMAMFTRIAMGSPTNIEIISSIIILIVSVVLIGILSAKIYKTGVLLYGTKPKLIDIIKIIFKS